MTDDAWFVDGEGGLLAGDDTAVLARRRGHSTTTVPTIPEPAWGMQEYS